MRVSSSIQLEILENFFGPQDDLNPKLWSGKSLHSQVSNKLLKIVKDFIDDHYLPDACITDIIITGSNASHNWSKHSDVDLHIIVDFGKVSDEQDLVVDYYKSIKSLWNNTHQIEVCGHEVEIYVQDKDEPHHANGVYSLRNSRWLRTPAHSSNEAPSQKSVEKKAKVLKAAIEELIQDFTDGDSGLQTKIERLKEKVKKMRLSGLERSGEYSIENLAFKQLRNEGYLDKLSDLGHRVYDTSLSIGCTVKESAPGSGGQEDTIAWRNQNQDRQVYPNEIVDAAKTLDTIRADHLKNLPLAQKLDFILQRSVEAERVSYQALRQISSFERKLDSALTQLSAMAQRISQGQAPVEPHQRIQDGDPESII